MRKFEDNGNVSVHAISGTYVVLLGFDAPRKATKGLLGFAINRKDHTEEEQCWLKGFKTFEETMPDPVPGQLVTTYEHPIQGFQWGDYTAKPGHKYTYKVVPLYGSPTNLEPHKAIEVTISTESVDNGVHAMFFNRGVAGSQAFSRKFGDKKPTTKEEFKWLSRGLEEAMLGFIRQAKGKRYALRAAVYEFSYIPVLEAFRDASKSKADVKIIYDARKGKNKPVKASDRAIRKAKIRKLMIRRTENKSDISHNKFIILLKNGEPMEVWTGSTNFTQGGIFGQSNVGHIIRNKEIAQKYFEYWQELSKDPSTQKFRKWNTQHSPVPDGEPPKDSLFAIFSPRSSLQALEWYAKRMEQARNNVCFTAAFGVNKKLVNVFKKDKEYLRYVILDNPGSAKSVRKNTALIMNDEDNRVAIGAKMRAGQLHRWLDEELTGMNRHVKYVHTKYMLLDALSADPILVSGSANFSDNSTERNDENMIIAKGNTRAADVYLGEFMRLFNHFYFRNIVNRQMQDPKTTARKASYLASNNSWCAPYYKKDSLRWKERLFFRGARKKGYGITFFDIDETIFHTFAEIWVIRNGKVIQKLNNQEYNTYKLKEGESFDFREFKDAKLFAKTSRIIKPTLAKIKAMSKNAFRTGSRIALLTARGTFPDMPTFIEKFEKYGIPIDKMDINFVGDISSEIGSTAEAKKHVVMKYLANGEYKRARLIDDNMENLKAFLSLQKEMPDVSYSAIYIKKDGKTKTINKKS